MALTAAERRALVRKRLAEASEPVGKVEDNTSNMTDNAESEPEPEPDKGAGITDRHPVLRSAGGAGAAGAGSAANRAKRIATQQRSSKPANYKLHVLTALSLTLVLRFSRYGFKAITG